MTRALIGLGGNIGDPPAAMAEALRHLDARGDTAVSAVSRLYRTPPWGRLDQPWFVNACAALETTLPPRDLLDLCLATERALKRERVLRWGPRTIDIDLLDHGGAVMDELELTLPHPRMRERAFVLVPLRDVAPDFRLGGNGLDALLARADAGGIEPASADGSWWLDAPTRPAPSA